MRHVSLRTLLLALTIAALVVGAILHLTHPVMGRDVWMLAVVITGAPVVLRTLRESLRGRFATDVVASLSIVGAVALDQPFAGLIIVLMQTGGESLEHFAERRATAAVRALEAAAPRIAHRVAADRVIDVPATDVAIGDVLVVRPGDLVPCDGTIIDGESELDTSSLTGESVPRRATADAPVLSGMLNGLGTFRMRATAPAEQSQYARIVQLVRSAQASKAPLQRVADRYAVWFTPITIAICGIAVWATHGWMRALAILVVATPCPLILATPVAIIGGLNRAARRQIIVRHGAALERIAVVNAAVFDKTGTLTIGEPSLDRIQTSEGFDHDTALRYAAAVEEGSSHLLARVLVDATHDRGLGVPAARQTVEAPGRGVTGIVDGHTVRVGARAFVVPSCEMGVRDAARLERAGATLRAYVSIDGVLAAVVEYADRVRPELPATLASIRAAGVRREVLLSGDHAPIARALAEQAGIRETYGDLLPNEKASFIERLQAEGHVVMMIGDGINDAPALSTADVGIALAAHGGGIAAESADIVLLVDSLERIPEAMQIGRRTMRIAKQSIWAGLGLSGVAMIVAAFGGLTPAVGAGLQEVIDVAVILNALRTSIAPREGVRTRTVRISPTKKQSSPHPGRAGCPTEATLGRS
ncbi:MAG TPA: heavy metal translocating P-type ATPase [Gemmatimonadaceae bacterium]|nr:heavy metal translocating P-type ATPase [Gemmatimonadaceae bacterium]